MENDSRHPCAFRLAKRLKDSEMEKELHELKVEELKAQLQSAEYYSAIQEKNVRQLSTKLEEQMRQSTQKQAENLKKIKSLQDRVQELTDLLERQRVATSVESGRRLQISKELDETRDRMAHQKTIKDDLIKKERETRGELERLMRLSSIETVNMMQIATGIGNDIKKKKKTVLLKEFEDLKVAHIMSQKRFSVELQVEKEKNYALMQELKQLKVSDQMDLQYETDLKPERESDSLQAQLKTESQAQAEKLEVINQKKDEKDAQLQRMEEETQTCNNIVSEKKESFYKELEDLKEKLKKETSTNQELMTKLQAEQEISQGLRMELAKLNEQRNKTGEQEIKNPIHDLPNVELLEDTEKMPPKKRVSVIHKFRHSFGLVKKEQGLMGRSKSTRDLSRHTHIQFL